ncbi:MAG: hypothetical protein GWP06_05655 [Actinobacteria bacterium]|nr:hypothetical protein [Actinomycetota bacterium]
MKKNIVFLILIFSLFISEFAYSAVYKMIRVGRFQSRVYDLGDQGKLAGNNKFWYYYFDGFKRAGVFNAGMQMGTRDWTDEYGNKWPVKISGAAAGGADETVNTMPVKDENGITIHKYMRYNPPSIIVDGVILNEPFPLDGDEVNPDKIPGTADVMVESWIRTSMGITIHQRVFGWSQTNHDDYLIYDWTFINTGNIDPDDEKELPNQTIKDFYFWRDNIFQAPGAPGKRVWYSAYGEYPSDSLRLVYAYSARGRTQKYDTFGLPFGNGYLSKPHYQGQTTLYADKSANDHSDDPSQPQMTGFETPELHWLKFPAEQNTPEQHALLYQTMQLGFNPFDGQPYMENTYPGTHHTVRMDEQGAKFVKDLPWWVWRATSAVAFGAYTLAPGDSIRIVWADVEGSISPEKAWEIGKAWKKGTCKPPAVCSWNDGQPDDNLPPIYQAHPDLYAKDSKSTAFNNWAKDCWVATGKDSLFRNSRNALWNVQKNYNIPIPPPPPSIEVKSLSDRVLITWGDESKAALDFAGYRVYRSVGSPYYEVKNGTFRGKFNRIFECGLGTDHPEVVQSYDDVTAERGKAYYYYVTAFDDGTQNDPGVNGERTSLESGKYLNLTTRPAHLTRAPGNSLSDIRVVPNPFNVDAAKLQYPGEKDKIMFLELPPVCTIRIYSESGDLVKTLEHTNGSGDEPWGVLSQEQSVTETGQVIVSGIYVAYIETPDGESTFVKFAVIR